MQVKYKGYEKLAFFRPISRFISKPVQDMVIVTMEDEYELTTHMRSMDLPKRRMVPFPMTFNEPLPRFQGHDIMNVK